MADPVEHEVHTRAKYAEALSKHPEIEQHFPTYEEWVEFMVLSDQQMAEQSDPEAVVNIESIDQFARMVAHWHANMLAKLRNMLEIPHGTQVGIEDDRTPGQGVKVTLKGDGMKGFQAAMLAAIAELKHFPFTFTEEQAAANDDAASKDD